MSRAALSSAERIWLSSLEVAPVTRTAVTATSDESRSHSQPPAPRPATTITSGEAAQERATESHWGRLRRARSDPSTRNFAAAARVWLPYGAHHRHRARRPARISRPDRRLGLILYLLVWAVVLPVQTIVVHSENPDDINAAYPLVNALILAGGVALNRLGAAMGERRRRRTSTAAG